MLLQKLGNLFKDQKVSKTEEQKTETHSFDNIIYVLVEPVFTYSLFCS